MLHVDTKSIINLFIGINDAYDIKDKNKKRKMKKDKKENLEFLNWHLLFDCVVDT